MKKFLSISLFIIISWNGLGSSPRLSYSEWVEDSLGIQFQFPRAWVKKIDRTPQTLIAEFSKDNRIILRLDSQIRTQEWDVDRFAEETLDQFLMRYPDLRVIQEIRLDEGYQGFDQAHFLVAHYREGGEIITNRFIFANKGSRYFITQVKAIRKHYNDYRKESDLFMKSLRFEDNSSRRWRNDSLNYLDPSSYESTILYIRDSLRPARRDNTFQGSRLEFRPEVSAESINNDSNSKIEPKRLIKDMAPGRNPPQGGIVPVTDEPVDPK